MKRLTTVDDLRAMLADHAGHTPVLLALEPRKGLSTRGPLTHAAGTTTSNGAYLVLTGEQEDDD